MQNYQLFSCFQVLLSSDFLFSFTLSFFLFIVFPSPFFCIQMYLPITNYPNFSSSIPVFCSSVSSIPSFFGVLFHQFLSGSSTLVIFFVVLFLGFLKDPETAAVRKAAIFAAISRRFSDCVQNIFEI